MPNEYQKINTLFLRDENNIIIPDRFTCPEFDYLKNCLWECTEKIDGTNIHIDVKYEFYYEEDGTLNDFDRYINICGRTSKATIPQHLKEKLCQVFHVDELEDNTDDSHMIDKAIGHAISNAIKDKNKELMVSLYGEGYGAKIQKGGNYIKNDVGFILFDVKVNDWWLNREACEQVASKLNIPMVPFIGYMTIPEAIEYVKRGFKSKIAENPDYDAEGLVLKTPNGLKFRNGERIITKIKTGDFKKFRAKYGDGPFQQIPNPHYAK